MAMQNTGGTFPLRDLDEYTVAEGDPDPRGWDVMSSDNQKVGEVKDLLVDVRAMKVRYLDVELDRELIGEPDRHVLFPVGTARLDDDEDRVIVGIHASRALEMPTYQKDGAVKREYEDSLFTTMGLGASMAAGAGIDPSVYYQRPEFETRDFYGKRGTTTGDLELRKPMARNADEASAGEATNNWKNRVDDKPRAMGPGESGVMNK